MPSSSKKTLVLGASANPSRYSYLAVNKLREHKHPWSPLAGQLPSSQIYRFNQKQNPIPDLDTVTLYLNPDNQKNYYNYILEQHPKRVIFNPGAENPEFEKILEEKGIQTVEACTLVLLSTGQY